MKSYSFYLILLLIEIVLCLKQSTIKTPVTTTSVKSVDDQSQWHAKSHNVKPVLGGKRLFGIKSNCGAEEFYSEQLGNCVSRFSK